MVHAPQSNFIFLKLGGPQNGIKRFLLEGNLSEIKAKLKFSLP